jgi:hypothetical protein
MVNIKSEVRQPALLHVHFDQNHFYPFSSYESEGRAFRLCSVTTFGEPHLCFFSSNWLMNLRMGKDRMPGYASTRRLADFRITIDYFTVGIFLTLVLATLSS